MIRTYEGFMDFFKKPEETDFTTELKTFFNISASDINYILCEITDDVNIDSEFNFRLVVDLSQYRLEIADDKFVLPKSDMRFCGFENMNAFIQRIGAYKKSQLSFDIEFNKKTDTDDGYIPTLLQRIKDEDPGKLPEADMKVINESGNRIKDLCGFKSYDITKRSSALHPITLWIMRFKF